MANRDERLLLNRRMAKLDRRWWMACRGTDETHEREKEGQSGRHGLGSFGQWGRHAQSHGEGVVAIGGCAASHGRRTKKKKREKKKKEVD